MSGPPPGAGQDWPTTLLEEVDRIATRFEEDLRAGQSPAPSIEEQLGARSGMERAKLLFELLVVELDHVFAHGNQPQLTDYLRRFPNKEDQEVVRTAWGSRPTSQGPATWQIGKYRVVRQIGVGGMGGVFEAIHEQTRRRVAIKVLLPQLSANPEIVARFRKEAIAASRVEDPGIVSILEVGELPDGRTYMVMEYLDGTPVGQFLVDSGGRLDASSAFSLARQIASTLAVVHGSGIIHRDLKPNNIMIVADREALSGKRVKILDFGVAKLTVNLGEETQLNTRQGVVVGTPRYIPPEAFARAAGADIELDDKADVYALGIMLHQFLTGRTPFNDRKGDELMLLYAGGVSLPLPPLSDLDPPLPKKRQRELQILLRAMLAPVPGERPTMREVAGRLLQLEQKGPVRAEMRSVVLVSAGLALVLASGAGLLVSLHGNHGRAAKDSVDPPVVPPIAPEAAPAQPRPAPAAELPPVQVRFRLVDPLGMAISCGQQRLRPECEGGGECTASARLRAGEGCVASFPGYESVTFSPETLSAHQDSDIRVALPPR